MPKLSDAEQKRRLAEKFGIDLSSIHVETKDEGSERSQQAEAVAAFMKDAKRFIKKLCGHCEGQFATDYGCVAFCSDSCRKAHLERKGIRWSPDKAPGDRWVGSANSLPLVVPPEALEAIRQWFEEVSAKSLALSQ